MLHYFSKQISKKLLTYNCIKKENFDIYVYGTELILSDVLSTVIIALLSVILKCPLQGLLFYLTFVTLRRFSGGLHCKTHLRCVLTFAAVYLVCIVSDYFVKNFRFRYATLAAMLAVTLAVILLLAPIENKNKPIERKDRKKFKILSVTVLAINLAVFCIIDYALSYKADIIIVTDLVVSLLMVAGLINNRTEGSQDEIKKACR